MMRSALLSLSVLLAAASQAQFSTNQTQFGPVVRWSTVAQGFECALIQPEWRVISSDAQWRTYFTRMFNVPPRDATEIPNVADFSKESLIVIAAGRKPTMGYGVYVSSISRSRTGYYDINVVLQEPHPQSDFSRGFSSPWTVIKVERTTGTPTIQTRTIGSNIIVHGDSDPWHGCRPQGDHPIYRMGQGGSLVPLNDAAKRALGQDVDGKEGRGHGRDRDKDKDKDKKSGSGS